MPDADVKIFMTTSPEVRAQRRYKELCEKGILCNYDDILADIIERDTNDSTRDIAPAVPAEDAVHFDNFDSDIGKTLERLIAIIKEKTTK